jgi:signal recognition particle subunit SRP68
MILLRSHSFVYLLLMSAERAWASAMSMKSAQSAESTQKRMLGSTKRQISSRLTKAIQYAAHLLNCLRENKKSHANELDTLEAAAYLSSLRGALYFEKTRWNSCIQEYSVARIIYATLGSTTRTDLFKDLLSNTIDPSIRYASYQLKFSRTKAVSDIAIEQFAPGHDELVKQIEGLNPNAFVSSDEVEKRGQTVLEDIPSTVTWRARTVKIEDASIAQAIATANRKEHELGEIYTKVGRDSRELAAAYDDVINARLEAVDATKVAIDELLAEGVDTGDARLQSLQLTRTAVNYAVIALRIGRNRQLCGPQDGATIDFPRSKRSRVGKVDGTTRVVKDESTSTKLARLRERVALYDSILRNIDAVRDLSGVAGDQGFMEELSGKRAYFRALKYASQLCY